MSYQVLARKYRPQSFDEVVGQEHVTRTLTNAILKNRLHHAYLLTGARGVGKTSLARILAKSLNCSNGPTPKPCNRCSNCDAITKGSFLDVIEIDGASNTSVESVRELREQVKYSPASGGYKVYIIDEVHMLSNAAFNALLKTLEEPPPHVIFIFATTEAHKIPVTILSRCQRFDLRRLSLKQIRDHLAKLCAEEKVGYDEESLQLLARSAEGSMRDAQSLLDMAIGLDGENLRAEPILEMLGLTASSLIEDLTVDCLKGNLSAALAKVEDLYHRGLDLRQVATQWVEYFHDLILYKIVGTQALGAGIRADQVTVMEKTVGEAELEDLQVAFQTIYRAVEEIARSESPKILFDLLLVKLVHGTPYRPLAQLLAGRDENTLTNSGKALGGRTLAPKPPGSTPAPTSAVLSENDLLERVLAKRPQIKAVLQHATASYWEGNDLIVCFESDSMMAEMFAEKSAGLADALSQERGHSVKIQLRRHAGSTETSTLTPTAAPEAPTDPIVEQALKILNASLQEVKTYGHE